MRQSAKVSGPRGVWLVRDLPTSCVGGIGVLAVAFRHTMADMQVTSLPPLRQSLLNTLIFLGSNQTSMWIRMTLRDLGRDHGKCIV